MNWSQWLQQYDKKLEHPVGFERKFVEDVLRHIPNLSPSDVVPQYHFLDSQGGNRFVDFMIINPNKNWLLPIELDGYAKMVGNGQEYYKFNDFLERQNAMIKAFGLVLRYTNKTMLNQPEKIIQEITDTLQRQSQAKSTRDIQERHTKQMIADYEAQINKLKQDNSTADVLKEMRAEIATLRQSISKPNVQYVTEEQPRNLMPLVMGFVVLFALGVGAWLYFLSQPTTEETVVTQAPTVVERVEVIREVPVATHEEPKVYSNPVAVEQPKPVTTTNTTQPEPIQTQTTQSKTNYQVGETINICGLVVEAKAFNGGGVWLNLDKPFPNQTMTLTVWNQSNLEHYVGKRVCTYGQVNEYKGRLSINVNSLKGLKEQ